MKFTTFADTIKARFPEVSDFEIDHYSHNVVPVKYLDGGKARREYPPVARWKVGNRRYAYVGKPRFVEERWSLWPIASGTHTRADYIEDNDALIAHIERSIAEAVAETMRKRSP